MAFVIRVSGRVLSRRTSTARFLPTVAPVQGVCSVSPRVLLFAAPCVAMSRGFAKKAKGGKGGKAGKGGDAAPEDESSGELPIDLGEVQSSMQSSLEYLSKELGKMRVGRASPELLEGVSVKAYGDQVPLDTVGLVRAATAQLLIVTVHDTSLTKAVEDGIRALPGMDLNPFVQEGSVHVPLPKPTREVRDALRKQAKAKSEDIKTSVRRARQTALQKLKKGSKGLSEDVVRAAEKDVQEATDRYIAEVEKVAKAKDEELSTA